ncbi:hypothetical protein [Leisingera thetidis]|uniref:hypothetical protein n=1 Tax=Leisingera thetidis TaxID=2930199 RepID=UPI0021F7C761|nr:hypothetical protein [Leisingera thetidis]
MNAAWLGQISIPKLVQSRYAGSAQETDIPDNKALLCPVTGNELFRDVRPVEAKLKTESVKVNLTGWYARMTLCNRYTEETAITVADLLSDR